MHIRYTTSLIYSETGSVFTVIQFFTISIFDYLTNFVFKLMEDKYYGKESYYQATSICWNDC